MRRCSLPASTRWVGRQFEAKRQIPTPRWHTASPSSSSASMPSGPACPPESWVAAPVLEPVPPAISGSRPACVALHLSGGHPGPHRSEEHTSELHPLTNLICRLLLDTK